MTELAVIEPPDPAASILDGVNVLLMGPAGTGKTHSLGTLVDTGIDVFYLALEPGLESLLGYWTDRGLKVPANLHWHHVAAAKTSFTDMLKAAKKVNTQGLDILAKGIDANRYTYDQFEKIYESLNDFPDDRTGIKYGCADEWGPSRVLVIDGMAGLCRAFMNMTIGGKAVISQSEWGIAMGQVERILFKLTDNCRCHFVLLAHVERETDMVLGGVKITLSSLGVKLSPKLMPMFSDCILSVREGKKFTWSTGSSQADTKTRNLPIAEGIAPDFAQIINKWKSRGGSLL